MCLLDHALLAVAWEDLAGEVWIAPMLSRVLKHGSRLPVEGLGLQTGAFPSFEDERRTEYYLNDLSLLECLGFYCLAALGIFLEAPDRSKHLLDDLDLLSRLSEHERANSILLCLQKFRHGMALPGHQV